MKPKMISKKEKVLSELIGVAGPVYEAPQKTARCGRWHQLTIGIGEDHTAYVTIDDDALAELCRRTGIDIKSITQDPPNPTEC